MKNIPVIKPLVVVVYEFIRWRRVRYWRSWWKDDVFFVAKPLFAPETTLVLKAGIDS